MDTKVISLFVTVSIVLIIGVSIFGNVNDSFNCKDLDIPGEYPPIVSVMVEPGQLDGLLHFPTFYDGGITYFNAINTSNPEPDITTEINLNPLDATIIPGSDLYVLQSEPVRFTVNSNAELGLYTLSYVSDQGNDDIFNGEIKIAIGDFLPDTPIISNNWYDVCLDT